MQDRASIQNWKEMGESEGVLTAILKLEADEKAVFGRVIVSKSTSISSSLCWQIVMGKKQTIWKWKHS